MRTKNFARLATAALAATLLASSANAVAFLNGSFEDGTFTGAPFDTLAPGDASMTGWVIEPAGVDWIGGFWQASNGNRSVDLSALSTGSVFQQISGLQIGKQYTVSFDLSANPGGGLRTVQLTTTTTGNQVFDHFYDVTAANSFGDMRYERRSFTFTAVNTMHAFQFLSRENNPFGPVIDNVSISLVPEPAMWAMMLAGFGLVGATMRRRSRAVAA
ncbi:choice-of-anchor C family PEP-CTERM protein [Sandarakinorhabdus sp.]|uniref:choice-of-anchor C family PEP-CTERM protein n=1 Tax=Sandarakinorhabdus sp. TaxID=1916663 RepID=UPI00286D9DD2|nr:choice-of-anchor C family protein [Sandarakinorhabdus sp.]